MKILFLVLSIIIFTDCKIFSEDKKDTKQLSNVYAKNLLKEENSYSIYLGTNLVIFQLKDYKSRIFSVSLYYENHIIDSRDIIYYSQAPHESFVSSECLCLEFSDPVDNGINKILYVNDSVPAFKIYSLNKKGMGGLYANKEFIYYVLEFADNTIFKIDVNNGKCFNYQGYFPDADIYETVKEEKRIIIFKSSFEYNAYIGQKKVFILSDFDIQESDMQFYSFLKEQLQIP